MLRSSFCVCVCVCVYVRARASICSFFLEDMCNRLVDLVIPMMKFASFENIVELIYKYTIPMPKDQCSKQLQLAVSFAGGYIAGVFCAVVSHPADNLVSFLYNAKGATVGDAVKKLGLWGLFTRGLPLRIVMIGTLTGAQWGICDAFKVFVGVPTTGGVAPAVSSGLKDPKLVAAVR